MVSVRGGAIERIPIVIPRQNLCVKLLRPECAQLGFRSGVEVRAELFRLSTHDERRVGAAGAAVRGKTCSTCHLIVKA
jgi:hypothetical protein